MVDVPDAVVIDMLLTFREELQTACSAGLEALQMSANNGSGTFTKLAIKDPCAAMSAVDAQIELVKAGKIKIEQ